MTKNQNSITLSLDGETLRQVRMLASVWGLLRQRNISAVVTRAVERTYTEAFTGRRIEELSWIDDDEIALISLLLAKHLQELDTTEETETVENLIAKVRGIR